MLGKLDNLSYVTSTLGLANVSINDDYVLTDKLNPRQFAELIDIDREVVDVLYMAYAYNHVAVMVLYLQELMIMRFLLLICSYSFMTSIGKVM